MVKKGEFRQDLFYRLNVIPLRIPSLRARPSDLASLVQYFLQKVASENDMAIKSVSVDAMEKLGRWNWPGNVRELQNVIERSCLMSENQVLKVQDIQIDDNRPAAVAPQENGLSAGMTIQEAEKRLIFKTLMHTGENRTKAAKILGISIRTLRNKLNEYKSEATGQV